MMVNTKQGANMLEMSKSRIPESKRVKIIQLVDEGFTFTSIAGHLAVHRNTVSRIIKKESNNQKGN
jgi:IS30 family transposase